MTALALPIPLAATRDESSAPAELRSRAQALMEKKVTYIANAQFQAAAPADDRPMLQLATLACNKEQYQTKTRAKLSSYLTRLCEAPLLSAQEERDLFRAMNYLRYRACVLQSQLGVLDPDSDVVTKLEKILEGANLIRDRIVQSNLRLVISIIRKYVTAQYSFDELLSDGIDTLMHTVDRFDFDRGFRFSTYAYRSITRTAYQQVADRRKELLRSTSRADELANILTEGKTFPSETESTSDEMRGLLAKLLLKLDRRERLIVCGRYVVERGQKAKTFQAMGDKLGISKERVRQIERNAVRKLRAFAIDMGMTDLLETHYA